MYEDFIYSAARGAGLSHEESRDVVQETMISVRDYVSGFVPDQSRARFRTWLSKIVKSRIVDRYRQKNRNPIDKAARDTAQACAEDSVTSATNRLPNADEIDLARFIDGKLEQAIVNEARRLAKDKVEMEHYQAYDLFHVQGLSAREVAVSLGTNAVTVRVRAFRVRRTIEREMRAIVRMLERPNRRS
jgi:RNA polymerase sigma factor (sigma-70 family)